MKVKLTMSDLLELKRWNTPTVYNGWEQVTKKNIHKEGFNIEPVTDFMPHIGPMVGYAVTVVIEPSNSGHLRNNPHAWAEYLEYVSKRNAPKVVIVQDIDKPFIYGAFWGEVNSNIHRSLGCVGSIIDGGIRDLDEIHNVGFKILARRACVGHAYSYPVRWDCEVEVFGRKVQPGQLVHADKHGFLIIPNEDEERLLDAVRFMDSNECQTLLPAAQNTLDRQTVEILIAFKDASTKFKDNIKSKFGNKSNGSV